MKKLIALLLVACTLLCFSGCQNDPGQDYTQEIWNHQHLGTVAYQVPESWGEPEYDSPIEVFQSHIYHADSFWVQLTLYETGKLTSAYENAQDYVNRNQEGYKEEYGNRSPAEMLDPVRIDNQSAEHFCYKTRYDDTKDFTYTEVYAVDVAVPGDWFGKTDLFVLEFHSSDGDGLKENARKTADQIVESVV